MQYTMDESANGMRTFLRNRYFYGKLMDVHQFESEQNYLNQKRWLLNRMVTGYGVLCGLNVKLTADGKSVHVTAGMALDKMGREIVVPSLSKPIVIPNVTADPNAPPPDPCDDGACAALYICFHECNTDPVPVFTGECDSAPSCSAGVIRERYELHIKEGRAPKIGVDCTLQDLISGGRINYEALANYISDDCTCPTGDGCIPLANIRLPKPNTAAAAGDIDISVRPIVYTNDLLFDLLLCLTSNTPNRPAGGKY